eukprot:7485675-Ditylum_brightwellii.AAC.1
MSDTNVTQDTTNNSNEKKGKEADNMTENKRTSTEEVDRAREKKGSKLSDATTSNEMEIDK